MTDTNDEKTVKQHFNWLTGVMTCVGVALGGGVGSGITAQGVNAELRETRAVIVGRIDKLEARYDSQDARLGRMETVQADLDKRVRDLEISRAAAGKDKQ